MQFDYTDFITLTEKYLKKNLKICYIFNSVSTVTKRFQILWHKLRFLPDITVKAENFWLATYRTFQDALLYDECLCVSTKQSKAKPSQSARKGRLCVRWWVAVILLSYNLLPRRAGTLLWINRTNVDAVNRVWGRAIHERDGCEVWGLCKTGLVLVLD
jgi:hypothetical protein